MVVRRALSRGQRLASSCCCSYVNTVSTTYDKATRGLTFAERGLDLEDARYVFAGPTFEVEDQRRDYGQKRVDGHVIQPAEYDELPELDDEMLARGKVNRGGRPRSANPKRLISIRLTEDVIQRWRATGPGWSPPGWQRTDAEVSLPVSNGYGRPR